MFWPKTPGPASAHRSEQRNNMINCTCRCRFCQTSWIFAQNNSYLIVGNQLQESYAHSRTTCFQICKNRVNVSAIANSSEPLQSGLSGCRCNLWDTRCSSGPYKASEGFIFWLVNLFVLCCSLIGQSNSNMFTFWWYDDMHCTHVILESAQVL